MTTLAVPHEAPSGTHDDRLLPSGFRTLLGLRIVEWQDGRCVIEIPVTPDLTNNTGVLSGAVIGAAVDMAGALAGCYTPPPAPPHKVVTLTYCVSFVAAARTTHVRATGQRQGGGNSVFTATVTVADTEGAVVAAGQGTFRIIR